MNAARAPRPSPALWRSGITEWFGRFPVLERPRSAFGRWWGDRSPRERRLLVALAATAAVSLLIAGIYRPLAATRARAAADIRTYEVLAAQLRTAGPELARLRALDRSGSPAAATGSASSYGLQFRQLPSADGVTRLQFDGVEFARLLQWLAQLETTTTSRVVELRIDRRPEPGLVSARVGLR
ncbi:MAG: hypothetical protein AVDCRST_MAG39-2285 [uncultured Sphingomonadaceae bacterium]|uniref:General secretion pathway protein M n=1 Tax=uncultured Sphingomonadaceae bacterium TaxID=169976 RepID=A0A6J4T9N9_9SPHN|nr:MAG: hypothetical protein AVDCRST_MAG39-2285 [uncultured Sphingomonadaceae bacterium]